MKLSLLCTLLLVACGTTTNNYSTPSPEDKDSTPSTTEKVGQGEVPETQKQEPETDSGPIEVDSGSTESDSGPDVVDSGIQDTGFAETSVTDSGGYAPGTKCQRTEATDSYCDGTMYHDDYTCTTVVGPDKLGQATTCQGQGGNPALWNPTGYHFCCN